MFEYQLLSPEEEVEELYPFRRVWRSVIIELTLVFVVAISVIVATLFGLVADTASTTSYIGLSVVPIAVFFAVSLRSERRVIQPRDGLPLVLVVSTIVANGVAIPLIDNVITPDRWLTQAGFFSRIFGHTLTLGIVAAFALYATLRYTIWPRRFRIRIDGIAYAIPAGIGYATVVNLHFMFSEEPTLSAAAIRMLTNVYLYVALSAVIGYFLAEIAVDRVPIYWLAMGLFITAFMSGLFAAFRRIAIVTGLGSRDVGALLLVTGFTTAILVSLAFLIENADARMEARTGVKRIR